MNYLKNFLLPAAIVLCVAFGSTARAEDAEPAASQANLFEILSDRGIRSSLQGKDLTAAWRMMRIAGAPEQTALLRAMSGNGRGNSSPWDDLYYTRGDVLSIAGQVYLVAYRVQPPSDPAERLRQQQFWQAWQGDRDTMNLESETPPLEEKSQLSLSLLSIGKSTNFNDIRAFDPEKDLLSESAKSKRRTQVERTMSRSNLKQISLGIMQYVQDYDEMLPPMRAAKTAAELTNTGNMNSSSATAPVQMMIFPYVRSTQIFLHPRTGRPYLPNYKISRKNLSSIEQPNTTILFFEDAPDAENKRSVAFLDGHVETLDEADWQSRRKAQGISESGFPPSAGAKAMRKPNPPRSGQNSTTNVTDTSPPAASAPPPPRVRY